MSKADIIEKVYFDKSGFNSKKATLADAREKDKSITMADINDFFQRKVEQKKQLKGFNSFVAPEHGYEYQVDLFFIGKKRDADLENQKFKLGMVMIDIFSKFAVVIPLRSKERGDIASGIIEGINKMGKKPDIIYTDDEGALSTTAMTEYFEKQKNTSLPEATRGSPRGSYAPLSSPCLKELKIVKRTLFHSAAPKALTMCNGQTLSSKSC